MLDLGLIKESYFEIKLPNGDVLNLLNSDKGMFAGIIEMNNKIQNNTENPEIMEDELYKFCTTIINRNKEKKVYKQKAIEEMLSIKVVMVLVEEYVKWIRQTINTPN